MPTPRRRAPKLVSQLCREATLTSPEFLAWSERLRPEWDPEGVHRVPVLVHRKIWEWQFICQALAERDMLRPGRRGLGFGVGREPLAALFASLGAEVTATDLEPERAEAAGWSGTGQHAGALDELNTRGICEPERFGRLVSYRYVDMNAVPDDLRGFDFTWSSCSFEHLGSIELGMAFILRQMRCLRPGGVAVHTTEYNASSNGETVSTGPTVLFRRSDIEALAAAAAAEGFRIVLDLSEGEAPHDRHVDVPPYSEIHLRTRLAEYEATSVGVIIERPPAWRAPVMPRLRRFARQRRPQAPGVASAPTGPTPP